MKKSFERAQRRREGSVQYKHDLGQHFLYDEALLEELVRSTGVTPEDSVLEIGPGSGMLTHCLCRHAKKVVAVEVDADVLPFLRVKTENFQNLQIVLGDIRKLDIHELCASLDAPFFVIANIPYNITTPIFDLLWDSGLPIRQISVMIQKEVADKLMAAPSTDAYGLLSFKCQYHCIPSMETIVPAEKFTPPPKVDSAFVHLRMRDEPPMPVADEKLLMRMVKASFTLRRKTLSNALKGVVETETLKAALETVALLPTARGEELTVTQWIALSNACHSPRSLADS
ncbi:MAG: 16S rRNA (adenine(1518)-N(6)/adenine(1519)-N(6))-dimethyltransferase RsmA [Eubacteriales bacterium]|nr:16S rRNA (adenine(1518)-N(6)/adenine(1519)-N(6))-dimethyltransferase RsmA [Eubacteriales bacterium]